MKKLFLTFLIVSLFSSLCSCDCSDDSDDDDKSGFDDDSSDDDSGDDDIADDDDSGDDDTTDDDDSGDDDDDDYDGPYSYDNLVEEEIHIMDMGVGNVYDIDMKIDQTDRMFACCTAKPIVANDGDNGYIIQHSLSSGISVNNVFQVPEHMDDCVVIIDEDNNPHIGFLDASELGNSTFHIFNLDEYGDWVDTEVGSGGRNAGGFAGGVSQGFPLILLQQSDDSDYLAFENGAWTRKPSTLAFSGGDFDTSCGNVRGLTRDNNPDRYRWFWDNNWVFDQELILMPGYTIHDFAYALDSDCNQYGIANITIDDSKAAKLPQYLWLFYDGDLGRQDGIVVSDLQPSQKVDLLIDGENTLFMGYSQENKGGIHVITAGSDLIQQNNEVVYSSDRQTQDIVMDVDSEGNIHFLFILNTIDPENETLRLMYLHPDAAF